jgi:ferredoxin
MRKTHRFGPRGTKRDRFINLLRIRKLNGSSVNLPAPNAEDELNFLRKRIAIARWRLGGIRQRIEGQETVSLRWVRAIVDDEECTGCGLCYEVCPVGAISVDGSAKIDAAKCTACLACVKQCPQGAIAVKY